MCNLKFGIIGVGNMGSAHLSCIKSGGIKNATAVAVCDISEERRKAIQKEYPDILIYKSYDELINSGKVDAVLVATPHKFHADIALCAIRNGINVLVEKPIDITITKAKILNDEAQKSGKVFGIMFNQRTNPIFQTAHHIVNSGQLGELKRSVWIVTNWYRTQAYYDSGDWRATWAGEGGGVLLNQAPHNLDIWQWICGMPVKLSAKCDVAKYHNIEVEDEAVINATFAGGAHGIFVTCTGEFPGTNRLEISGTLGKIVLENGTLKWWKLLQSEKEVRFNSMNHYTSIDTEYLEIKPSDKDAAHKGILQNFTNAVLFGEKLISPGFDGINELTISNAAYLSSWSGGKEIEIPFNNLEFDSLLSERVKNSKYHQSNGTSTPKNSYSKRWSVKW